MILDITLCIKKWSLLKNMNKVKVKGIVISETNYSESSKVLNILTEDYGNIGVISKGCRNYKSKLRSVSIKLTYAYFYINYKEDGLSTLTEADIINDFKNIKTDLVKIGYCSYLIDLANQVIRQSDSKEIFTVLENAKSITISLISLDFLSLFCILIPLINSFYLILWI